MNNNNLAVFDFDHTLTFKDSMIDFLIFYKGYFCLFFVFFINTHYIILICLNLYQKTKLKERLFIYFFKNKNLLELIEIGNDYARYRLPKIINLKVFNLLNQHKKNGDKIIILTASCEIWLSLWVKNQGVELISTLLENKNGVLTGKILGKNCKGKEKLIRLNSIYNLKMFKNTYGYGNRDDEFFMNELEYKQFF